jgi:hypothetical protein
LYYNLLVLEVGLSLLGKSSHALLLVVGAKETVESDSLKLETGSETDLSGLVDRSLGGLDSQLAVRGDLSSSLDGLVNELGGLVDLGGQTPVSSLLSSEHLSGKNVVVSSVEANGSGESLGSSSSGNDTKLDLGLAKLGLGAGVDDVGHHGKLASTTEGKAVDGSNDGFLDVGHVAPLLDEVLVEHGSDGLVLHLLDVGAGSKGLLGSGENDGANGGVGISSLESLVQLLNERSAQGVEGLGPVEGDESDLGDGGGGQDVLVLLVTKGLGGSRGRERGGLHSEGGGLGDDSGDSGVEANLGSSSGGSGRHGSDAKSRGRSDGSEHLC